VDGGRLKAPKMQTEGLTLSPLSRHPLGLAFPSSECNVLISVLAKRKPQMEQKFKTFASVALRALHCDDAMIRKLKKAKLRV
jgi:hypothetical protein